MRLDIPEFLYEEFSEVLDDLLNGSGGKSALVLSDDLRELLTEHMDDLKQALNRGGCCDNDRSHDMGEAC